jgi:hypothetical protein
MVYQLPLCIGLCCSSGTLAAAFVYRMLSHLVTQGVCIIACLQLVYTLQVHVLDQTGLADITADVNFAALRRSVASIKGTTTVVNNSLYVALSVQRFSL